MLRLLETAALERSSVVANSTMNRERGITGFNSYTEDLGFDPLRFLRERLRDTTAVSWLDLCCGSGRALLEAGEALRQSGQDDRISISGIDLVPMFYEVPTTLPNVRLLGASLSEWMPDGRYDLITCVHGLHYLGDKLEVIARAVGCLAEGGRFAANLDPDNLRIVDGDPADRRIVKSLRAAGIVFDSRRRLLTRDGSLHLALPYLFVGADDRAGPNYTGQPAVNSYYRQVP